MRYTLLMFLCVIGCRPGEVPPTPGVSVDAPPASEAAAVGELDIRSVDGTVIIPADDIIGYEWATHVMRLRPGVKDRVFRARMSELVDGSPFAMCVGGRPVYHGVLTALFSSNSQESVVIRGFDENEPDRSLSADALWLETGYPSAEYFKGPDPRGDTSIRASLDAAGKVR